MASLVAACLSFFCTFLLNAQTEITYLPWWPQDYKVRLDNGRSLLSLSTPYYLIEQDLTLGGNITRVNYTYGKAENLLMGPVGVRILTGDDKEEYSDMFNSPAEINYENSGKSIIVTTNCYLRNKYGENSAIYLKTIYEYRWGYIKIKKELLFPDSINIKKLSLLNFRLNPELSDYGYRPGITEQANTLPFGFNVIKWRKQRSGTDFDLPLYTGSVPEYLVFLNKGVEGIEWFMSDNSWQWDYQITGKPGTGLCSVNGSYIPRGIDVAICPVNLPEGSIKVKGTYVFEYYIGLSILPGHANKDWLHAVINRNKGEWISQEQVKEWSRTGVRTLSYQDDGDLDHDSIFWKDGIYPPYSDTEMKKLDNVLDQCHSSGMKTSAYFSMKELYPSAVVYKDSSEIWGRKYNDRQELKFSYANAADLFGVEMCLKSGWKNYFKSYVDMVISKHKFDGIYYDWNIPLYCTNPLHVGKKDSVMIGRKGIGIMNITPEGHRDIDELIELMEWTRKRVGPDGIIIIHNTMAPMLVTENFANYVVSMEWGYGKLIKSVPSLNELAPEWNFAGARSRGVIGNGTVHNDAPPELRKRLALEALITGVTPWPVNKEAVDLHNILKPLGELVKYRFTDWKNNIVSLSDTLCSSAVYSKPDTTFVIIVNLGKKDSRVNVKVNTSVISYPIGNVSSVCLLQNQKSLKLKNKKIITTGEKILIPPCGEVLLRIVGENESH